MAYCLPKHLATDFLNKIKNGTINPVKLGEMSSQERREFFGEHLGVDNAKEVNALFESKLLLKNVERGMITWAKQVTGLKKDAKRDLLSRVQKLEDVLDPVQIDDFMEDLAEKKLGVGVTEEEARQIYELSQIVKEKKAAIPEDSPNRSKERMEYGFAHVMFRDYVVGLKEGAIKPQVAEYIKNPGQSFIKLAGLTKSVVASLDNSLWGRQNFMGLARRPDIWVKNFALSWKDMAQEITKLGLDPITVVKAEIASRPNAINDKYNISRLGVNVVHEEAMPTSLPEKIPLLGRLFKASETAFSAGSMRMRADLFDMYVAKGEKAGLDFEDKDQLRSFGRLVNQMTGRGDIGALAKWSEGTNATIFSLRYMKARIDNLLLWASSGTFTGETRGGVTAEARRASARNLLQAVGLIASIMAMADFLDGPDGDTVEWDPRSANFGKLKFGDTRIDITGGMASLVTLAARTIPTMHDGKRGQWYKSSSSGKFTELNLDKFGAKSVAEVFLDFFLGKLSPLAGAARDKVLTGKHFGGEPVTLESTSKKLITPITIDTIRETLDHPDSAPLWLVLLLEGSGFSANTYNEETFARKKKEYEQKARNKELGLEPGFIEKSLDTGQDLLDSFMDMSGSVFDTIGGGGLEF